MPGDRLKVGKPRLTYSHVRREPGGPSEEVIWLEIRLEPGEWVVAYRLVPHDGRHAIAEARLLPYEPDAEPGAWSGAATVVPARGVPFEILRELRTDGVLKAAQDVVDYLEERVGQEHVRTVLSRFDLDRTAVGDVVQRRQRRANRDVARAASAYASAPAGTRLRAVAEAMCCSVSNASNWIADARSRGYLDDDDHLTERARDEL